MNKIFNYLLRNVRNVIYKRDREFIKIENKHLIPYEKIKKINSELFFEFRHELNFHNLLFKSIEKNDVRLAKQLIQMGVNVNHKDYTGKTLLTHACSYNSYECVKLLVESGADVNQRGACFENPLYKASAERNYKIAKLLIENGADVNSKTIMDDSPLFHSCVVENYKLVKLLIKNGANVNQTNWQNKTVLYHIVPHRSRKSRKIYNLLVKHGAHE